MWSACGLPPLSPLDLRRDGLPEPLGPLEPPFEGSPAGDGFRTSLAKSGSKLPHSISSRSPDHSW